MNHQLNQKRLSHDFFSVEDLLEFEEILSEALLTPDGKKLESSDSKSNQIKLKMFTHCDSQTFKPRNQITSSSNFESIINGNKYRKEDLFSSTKSIQIGGGQRLEAGGDFGSTLGSNYIPCFQEVASREVSAVKRHFYDSSELRESKVSSDCLTVESKRKKLLGNIPELRELVSGAPTNDENNKENDNPEKKRNKFGYRPSSNTSRLKPNTKN